MGGGGVNIFHKDFGQAPLVYWNALYSPHACMCHQEVAMYMSSKFKVQVLYRMNSF